MGHGVRHIERRGAAVLAAASLLAVGCGGGSAHTSSPTSTESQRPLSKVEYAAAVHRICDKLNQQEKGGDLSSMSAVAKSGDRAVELERARANRIAGVKPPSQVEALAQSFVDQLRARVGKIREMIEAATEHDSDKFFVAHVGFDGLFAGILKDEHAIGFYCFRKNGA